MGITCDCCNTKLPTEHGQYFTETGLTGEFICQYCLEEMYASGPEDMYSYDVG